MKKIFFTFYFIASQVYAAPVLEILPSSASPIALALHGHTYLTYTVKNKTPIPINRITIDPNHQISLDVETNVDSKLCDEIILKPGATCSFTIKIQAIDTPAQFKLMPKVCAFNNKLCAVPTTGQQVNVSISEKLSSTAMPRPYAGSYYPIYNSGTGQWLPPDQPPFPPFNEVSTLLVAFAHAYPQGNGAVFSYETGQPEEPARLALLTKIARSNNPHIRILISLGWDKNDWTYINSDYVNHANIFVPSVINFIRSTQLDGMDIDDESIGEGSGTISQAHFDGVIANLRNALNYAALKDGKPYYLTITPAGNNQGGGIEGTQVDAQNVNSFDLINIQTYFGSDFSERFYQALLALGYPSSQIANGVNSEADCNTSYPPYVGFAGLFNWNMTADSICGAYNNTKHIADLVHYPN